MIISIDSDLPSFKPVLFNPGLNVLLSDKSPQSGEKQTRNSAGKSSLLEIIHFLLGSKAGPKSLLRNPALAEYTFHCTLAVGGMTVTVARSGSDPSKVLIDETAAMALGLSPRKDKKQGGFYVSNEVWKELLGNKMFGLPGLLPVRLTPT